MDWSHVVDTFSRMTAAQRQPWLLGGAALLALLLGLLWLESRFFKASGRVGSWFALRLVSTVATPLTLLALLGPALAISGPEALGVFYLSLLTTAPAVWFGSHWLAGRWLRPPLSAAESFALAVSGLALLAIPVFAALYAEAPLHATARAMAERRELPADNPPLGHSAQPVRRYTLPGIGLFYTQSLLAGAGTRLQRVEQRRGSQWPTDHATAHLDYCIQGNDLHLMWAAADPPPYVRLHWTQADGTARRAEFTPNMVFDAASPPEEFVIGFRPDGVDPSAPIPRQRAYLVLIKPGLSPYTQMLGSPPGVGEVRDGDCVAAGFRRPTGDEGWRVQALGLMFNPISGGALRALVEAPALVQ